MLRPKKMNLSMYIMIIALANANQWAIVLYVVIVPKTSYI